MGFSIVVAGPSAAIVIQLVPQWVLALLILVLHQLFSSTGILLVQRLFPLRFLGALGLPQVLVLGMFLGEMGAVLTSGAGGLGGSFGASAGGTEATSLAGAPSGGF